MKQLLPIILVIVLLTGGFWLFTQRSAPTYPSAITFADGGDVPSGFARAFEPRQFQFPQDHGPHFGFQTEWWYYTGNVQAENGEHFGYQLTFFRRGLTPGAPPLSPDLATNQIYFAHFALTDVAGDEHTFAERFSRGAAGLSGATGEPFQVWLEDWSAASLNSDGSAVRLRAKDKDIALDLTLRATKPIVAQGDGGLSQKSEEAGNASYYLSFTRMATTGQVTARGETVNVDGESWFDHEWSTSALGGNVAGWNWFSLQLSDGRELMFYQFRLADGGIGRLSAGTLIEPDGTTRHLSADEVQIQVEGSWRSPETDADYPARWRMTVPSAQIEVTVTPWIAAQEMRVSATYWEGAVKISGSSGGLPVTGDGYVELTGYKGSLKGVF